MHAGPIVPSLHRFVLLAVASQQRESGLYLIFPVFFAPPVVLSAFVVFAPLERYLDGHGLGHLKNAGVPLLGGAAIALLAVALLAVALLALALLVLLSAPEPGPTRSPVGALTVRDRLRGVLVLGGTLGAVGGALWRLTDWAVTLVGLRGRA